MSLTDDLAIVLQAVRRLSKDQPNTDCSAVSLGSLKQMCGITGLYNFKSNEPVDQNAVRRMAAAIAHRGPDSDGFYFSGALGLGFRRLSIIDLEGGSQPMSDATQKVWVVFNGEIYNHLELRAQLEQYGHVFRTRCDTEVIVHGYKQWGDDVFNHLNGMFGVGIWDEAKRRLIVARDSAGMKLVYYRLNQGTLTFCSEIRGIRANDLAAPELDPLALSLFLRFRYTPSPDTIYKGVRKLAPGQMLVVEAGQCVEKTWYNYTPVPFTHKSDKEAEDQLLELYRAAVKRHLISDVPVGILLSGGLDSGLLLGLMAENGKDWPAYTVGYGSSFKDDELDEAAESARILGARHVKVQLSQQQFERFLPTIVERLEEPVSSASIVPMYFVCQRARQDVKVVIIGQGPDELFGGYKRHIGVNYGSAWRKLPTGTRRMIASLIRLLPDNETVRRGMESLGKSERLERYQDVFSLMPDLTVASLFRKDFAHQLGPNRVVPYWASLKPQMEHLDELGGFQHLELRSSLPDELLMYGDKMTMAHGVEGRMPYLDREVVEFAERLKSSQKIRFGQSKWVHRQVCRKFLPKTLLKRKKKAFAVNVVDEWFKSSTPSHLADMLRDPQSTIYKVLQPGAVEVLLDQHRTGARDNHKILFSLAVVEQLFRGAGAR